MREVDQRNRGVQFSERRADLSQIKSAPLDEQQDDDKTARVPAFYRFVETVLVELGLTRSGLVKRRN